MKKILSFVLGALLCCSTLFGCSGGGGNVMHTGTVDDPNGNLSRSAADLVVVVEYGGNGIQHWLDLKNAFQERTGKTVYLDAEKGISDLAPDQWSNGIDCGDVYSVNTNPLPYIAQGQIEKLDSLYSSEISEGKMVKDTLWDSYKDFGYVKTDSYEGYYWLPLTASTGGLFYNQSILEDAYSQAVQNGHATVNWGERAPETYAELLELVDDINAMACNTDANDSNNIYPFTFAGPQSNYWSYWVETWFVQMIGMDKYVEYAKIESIDNYNPNSTNRFALGDGTMANYAEAKQMALELMAGLVLNSNKTIKNVNPYDIATNYLLVQTNFAEGKAAMMPNGAWLETELSMSIPISKLADIRYASVPYAPKAQKDSGTGEYKFINNALATAQGILIPAKAQHKELANEFLKFMVEEENLKNVAYTMGRTLCYDIEVDFSGLSKAAQDINEVCVKGEEENGAFFFVPKNEVAFAGKANFWYFNAFSYMLTGDVSSRKTAAECISQEYVNAQGQLEGYIQ
ncbi:MAG: extracellular solute-binding protein [Clostridia bacterium]|nr:extracellular solute-binding protein [Clostridia bacterium]